MFDSQQKSETAELTTTQVNLRLRARIAELMAENNRLLEADRQKSEVIGRLIHDLRGLITSFNLRLYLFERSGPERRAGYMQELKESVGQLTKLAENMLTAAREGLRDVIPTKKKTLH